MCSKDTQAERPLVEGTNLWSVYQAICRQAEVQAKQEIALRGDDIARETGLTKPQVHDCIFMLIRRGLIKKVSPGARYRPIVLQVPSVRRKTTEDNVTKFACPNCGQRMDLVEMLTDRVNRIQTLLKQLREATNPHS